MVPFYQFEAISLQGKPISLADYQGKVILVVNTASQCKLTPQFKGLETLYQQYQSDGLVILGFPCNQFNAQEPGTDAEIKEFCQANYGIDFLMSKKIEVNGDDAHPLFKYLVSECDVDSVPWNFTKFLVNEDEIVLMAPHTTPEEIDVALLKILN